MLLLWVSNLFINFLTMFSKKQIKVFSLFTTLFIIIFIGTETSHNDSYNYFLSYNNAPYERYGFEFGYLLLERIGNFLGFNYITYRLFISSISVILLVSSVKRYSKNVYFVCFFSMLYLIFIDAIQLRNLLAYSLVIYSFRFLIEKNNIKYILFVLLASTIHVTSVIYLILIFINFKKREKIIKIIIFSTLLISTLTILNDNKIFLLENILQLFEDNEKILYYFSSTTQLGYLLPLSLHLFNTLIVYISKKIFERNSLFHNEIKTNDDYKVIRFTYLVNLISLVFLPLYIMDVNFYRLSRNYILFNLIASSIAFESLNKNIIKQILFSVLVFLNVFSWYFYEFIFHDPTGMIVRKLLQNSFFKSY